MNYMYLLAEAVRFELTNGCPLPVFKTGAIDHSATPPKIENSTMAPLSNRLAEFSVFLLLQYAPLHFTGR